MASSKEPSASNSTPQASPEDHARATADRLRATVAELASQLRPFPGFFGMSTLQAIELELPCGSGIQPTPELGCVVILQDGEISELDLMNIAGPDGPDDVTELDLPANQYIAYATVAVRLLQAEIERRGRAG